METNYFTILYWFCHTSTWIHHGCTHVPHPKPPSHLPSRTIPLGHPSAPAPSILYPALNLDWQFISYMILYMFQCHSPKSSLKLNIIYLFIATMACGTLVPPPGIEPVPLAVEAWSPNHWTTRELLASVF